MDDTQQDRRIDPTDIQDRRDLARYLSLSVSPKYKVPKGDGAISQTATYIKTYLVEAHHADMERLSNAVAPYCRSVRHLRDERLLHTTDTAGESYFFDIRDQRFVLVHTIGEARTTDELIERITDSSSSGFDRAWMPSPFLKKAHRGLMTGFKYAYQEEATGFGRAGRKDQPAEAAVPTKTSRRRSPSFRLEISGQWDAAADLQEMEEANILTGRKSLDAIEFRESDNNGRDINLATYSFGKMVGHGTSLDLHLLYAAGIARAYGAIIRKIEDEFALGWRRDSDGRHIHRGAPFVIRFPPELVVDDLQQLAESIFRPSKPFRLFALFSSSSDRRIDIEAIDLHTMDPLSLEVTREWMRVYLPEKSCGNVVARLFTTLQHGLHSGLTMTTGSGLDLFEKGIDGEA